MDRLQPDARPDARSDPHESPHKGVRVCSDRPSIQAALDRLGQNLRTARLARNESQASLAARAGLQVSMLQRIERGQPGVGIEKVAQVLWAIGLLDNLDLLAGEASDPTRQRLMVQHLPQRGGRTKRRLGGIDPSAL